jgi:hypothetical protein
MDPTVDPLMAYIYAIYATKLTVINSIWQFTTGYTQENLHMCVVSVEKGFTQFSNLKIHSLVHTGERPHLCKECGRRFRWTANLQKHALLHTGQKPHVCCLFQDLCMSRWTKEPQFYTYSKSATQVWAARQDFCDTSTTAKAHTRIMHEPSNTDDRTFYKVMEVWVIRDGAFTA